MARRLNLSDVTVRAAMGDPLLRLQQGKSSAAVVHHISNNNGYDYDLKRQRMDLNVKFIS